VRIFLVFAIATALFADGVAGLHWTAPAGWKAGGPKPMRAATYVVDDAECVVYFFGQGEGGSVPANIERWKGQFSQPNGQPVVAKTAKRTIHGLPVTTIELAGNYGGMAGPMGGAPAGKTGYRMLGAIVENPGGNIFLKFTGPAKTIGANQVKFDQLLGSIDKDHH
jgi:hypothetical protein